MTKDNILATNLKNTIPSTEGLKMKYFSSSKEM